MGAMGEWGVGFDVRARARARASASESDAGARVVRCGVVFASDARTPTPCALAPTSKGEHAVLTMDVLGDVDARLRARAREDGDEEESEAWGSQDENDSSGEQVGEYRTATYCQRGEGFIWASE